MKRLKNGSGRDRYTEGSAALAMTALHDPEDCPPLIYRVTMNDDREITETLAPPTDREPPTNPANEKPEPRRAMNPPAGAIANPFASPPDWWEGSFFQDTFNKMQGGFAALEKAAAGQDAILAAIQRADANQTANYNLLRAEIGHLKDSDLKQDERLKEGDKRFDYIEKKVADLEDRAAELLEKRLTEVLKPIAEEFDEIRKLIADLRADVTARPAAPKAAEPA
jgi:hypothetical protein